MRQPAPSRGTRASSAEAREQGFEALGDGRLGCDEELPTRRGAVAACHHGPGLAGDERARGVVSRFFETFGRVPMFYYLLHIPLIHAVALAVFGLRDGGVNTAPFNSAPYVSMPPEQRWGLPLLYLIFAVVNIGRHVGTDPEMALRGTNTKFRRRFAHIERELEAGGETLDNATLERMEELWQAAKAIERQLG